MSWKNHWRVIHEELGPPFVYGAEFRTKPEYPTDLSAESCAKDDLIEMFAEFGFPLTEDTIGTWFEYVGPRRTDGDA